MNAQRIVDYLRDIRESKNCGMELPGCAGICYCEGLTFPTETPQQYVVKVLGKQYLFQDNELLQGLQALEDRIAYLRHPRVGLSVYVIFHGLPLTLELFEALKRNSDFIVIDCFRFKIRYRLIEPIPEAIF